jgi:hypothetical protein
MYGWELNRDCRKVSNRNDLVFLILILIIILGHEYFSSWHIKAVDF